MKFLSLVVIVVFLTGCQGNGNSAAVGIVGSAISLAVSQGSSGYGGGYSGARGGSSRVTLPNTRQCKKYKRFALTAGAPGTYSRLTQLYNACLNSKRKSAASRKYRCGPGKYRHKISGVWVCK